MIRPLGTLPDAGAIAEPQTPTLRLPSGHLQTLATPDPLYPLRVHLPALPPEQCRDAAVAVAPVDLRQLDNPRHQVALVRGGPRTVALRRSRLTQDPARGLIPSSAPI